MRSLELYARMLRYRVAAMIWMFLLLAAAFGGGLREVPLDLLWATVSLASGYVAATTVNDVADREIDLVNHPADRGRPLVTGEASEAALLAVHRMAAGLALAFALPLGWAGVAIVATSLLIGWMYSVGPVRFSYRTYLAPLVLGIAYVLVPYGLGLVVADTSPGPRDALFAAALFSLFVARINLKDFRDRDGDARYGKPTLLLRFGKDATCAVSLVALLTGNLLLLAALRPPVPLAIATEAFVAAIAWMLLALHRAGDTRDEQVAIGIGARMGNGLLISVLGWLLLAGQGASESERAVFVIALAALYGASYFTLLARPHEAVIGYKG
jgi:4-hydroxybenzoate polyprenyltransferase